MLEQYCDSVHSKTVKSLRSELGNETDEDMNIEYNTYKQLYQTSILTQTSQLLVVL